MGREVGEQRRSGEAAQKEEEEKDEEAVKERHVDGSRRR